MDEGFKGRKIVRVLFFRPDPETTSQIVFRFAQQVGMLPLTGTSDVTHMQQDLDLAGLELDAEELATIDRGGR